MCKRILKSVTAMVLSLCMLVSMASIALASEEATTDMTSVSAYALEGVTTQLTNTTWIDVRNTQSPFEVYGLHDYANANQNVDGTFVRMDHSIATEVTDASLTSFSQENLDKGSKFYGGNVWLHNQEPSGARVRFSTNSKSVALQVHAPVAAFWGKPIYDLVFDLYVDTADGSEYYGSFAPESTLSGKNVSFEDVLTFDTAEERSITIYFCYLNPISDVYVGFDNDSNVGKHAYPYEEGGKMVWFGSSITQGGVVTRPGKTFAAIVSRETNTDFLNLGYWGSAKGQQQIAQEIARQVAAGEVCAVIMDYDHNENDPDTLKTNHWNFYSIIRAADPDVPIVMISRPNHTNEKWKELRAAIKANYETALGEGDRNVYYIDGQSFWNGHDHSGASNKCTVCLQNLTDGTHPNDEGAQKIANKVVNLFKDAENGWDEGLALYENDFSDDSTAADFTVGKGQGFTIANGKMNFDVTGESIKYPLAKSAEWDNYAVSAKVSISSDTNKNLFGIYARGGSVRMLLRHNGAEKLRLRVYTTGNTYYESGDIYDFDTEYTLKIIVKGSDIQYFIDDNQVFSDKACISTVASGAAGIETFCGSDRRTVATVDDFTVRAIGSAGEPVGIIGPSVVLAQVGEAIPAFDFKLDYGMYGVKKMSSTDEGVTVKADTSREAITEMSISYGGFTTTSTLYVLQDKSKAYVDDFSSLNTSAWSVANATVSGGVMTVTNGSARLDKLAGATEWTDYIVEVDITTRGVAAAEKVTTACIGVRNASSNTGYEYGPIMNNSNLTGSGFRLYERGTASVNNTYSGSKPVPGVADHLRIVASGENIKFYLLKGNEYVLTHEVTNTVHDKGTIRFYVNTACFAVDFDNLLVIPLSNKTLQDISLPQETVDVPMGAQPDLEMTLDYGIHGTETVSVFDTEGVEVTYNPNQAGRQTLTVQYGGKTASMTVNVCAQTALVVPNFTVEKGQTPKFSVYGVYGSVKVKSEGTPDMLSGLDVNKVGRQIVLATQGEFTARVIVTVVESYFRYADFEDVANGTAPQSGWNVTTYGTVQDGVFTTNGNTAYYLNGGNVPSAQAAVSADFRLTNLQNNFFYDSVTTGKNTGYGVVRLGAANHPGQAIALNVMLDDQCKPYVTLTGHYGPNNLGYDFITFDTAEFTEFTLETFFNLELAVKGNKVIGYVNGEERVSYTFDITDTQVPEGYNHYNPAGFYADVLSQVTRQGIVANGVMVPSPIGITVDVDNFVIRELPVLAEECDHLFAWVTVQEPTCTTVGVKQEECLVCGTVRNEGTAIPATGVHTYDDDYDADCNECGDVREVEPAFVVGDLNADNIVTDADAVYLLMHTFFNETYPVNQPCDFNGDNAVTDADAVHLLMYTFFPDMYPIG